MELGGFIGRFHPLLVHLPIGFLILAVLLEYFSRKPKYTKLQNAVGFSLFVGAILAILSCLSGWLLANQGAYIERTLSLHRWLGIGVAGLASLSWLIKTGRIGSSDKMLNIVLSALLVSLLFTGHLGGHLTHGEDYLVEYAPDFIKEALNYNQKENKTYDFSSIDSVEVFSDLIQPIFKTSCWKCHRPDNTLGGLDMSTKEAFLKGGDHGAVLEAGSAFDSELFRRITLPVSNRKSMPPTGLPLAYEHKRLIEWWINTGASFEQSLNESEIPTDIQHLLENRFNLSFKTVPLVERIEVEAADTNAIDQARRAGFQISNLSETSNLLEVTGKAGMDLSALETIKDQITWLDLSDAVLNDDQISYLKNFPHLTRLRLQRNPVTDTGIAHLAELQYLESLNLNQTKIRDGALETIKEIQPLKRLYLFETAVTDTAIMQLQMTRPNLEIIRSFQFRKPESE